MNPPYESLINRVKLNIYCYYCCWDDYSRARTRN